MSPARLPTVSLQLRGRRVEYTLRMTRQARRVGLVIRADTGLVATAPPHATESQITAFIERHGAWVLRQLERFAAVSASRRRWPYGPTLLYRGEPHVVVVAPSDGRPAGVD